MPVRDAVAGDAAALNTIAQAMEAATWRCDDRVQAPSQEAIAAWIAGLHGRHVFVIDTLGTIEGGMVHQASGLVKGWILEHKLGFMVRLVQLCNAVWNLTGDCYGTPHNPAFFTDLRTDGRFTIDDTTGLVHYHP